MPVFRAGVSPRYFMLCVCVEEGVGNAEIVKATKLQQSLTIIIHPTNSEVFNADWA